MKKILIKFIYVDIVIYLILRALSLYYHEYVIPKGIMNVIKEEIIALGYIYLILLFFLAMFEVVKESIKDFKKDNLLGKIIMIIIFIICILRAIYNIRRDHG